METIAYDMSIMNKVHELFDYRLIPSMIDSCGLKSTDFLDKLYHLQYVIFELDKYLEQNWELDEIELEKKWHTVETYLSTFDAERSVRKLMSQLRVYESHEMNLRLGKRPENVDIRYFYYYKSCDVKLMRNLIIDKAIKNDVKLDFEAIDWVVFDWVTEMNDDVDDLEEDRETNNCNRLLFALQVKDNNAIKEYLDFLEYLETKAMYLKSKSNSSIKENIYNFTLNEIQNTKKMLGKI